MLARFSLLVNAFRMPALPLSYLRNLQTPAMSMQNNSESIKNSALLKKDLRCRFDKLIGGTDFVVGGKAIMPDPCLDIQGFGKFDILASRAGYLSDLKALSTFASSEKLIDLEARNTLQIDASKISITNPSWALALNDLVGYIGKDMNFEVQNVQPKLCKLLISGPGGHCKPHVDNEKRDGMFGTFMIDLSSYYKGGDLVVSHRGITKSFDDRAFHNSPSYRAVPSSAKCKQWFTMRFLAHYADCKHEVSKVSSGYRFSLIYSLCRTQICENAPAPKTMEEISNDIMRHLSFFDGCLGYILEHHYSIASLARYGAKVLKGNDRTVYNSLTYANLLLKSQATTSGDKLAMYIVQASREDYRGGNIVGEPEFSPYSDDIFAMDGSEPTKREINVLRTFQISAYEDVINHREPVTDNGDDRSNSKINDRFWRDEFGREPTYTVGDQAGTPALFYTTFILTFWRENWSRTIVTED